MKSTLAIVTCQEFPDLTPDDRLLLEPLGAKGLDVQALAWDAGGVDWGAFGGILVRSPWDYFERPEAFHQWLEALHQLDVPVWNPAAVMRSNTDKRYLRQLETGGVRIPLTHWIDQGSQVDLQELKRLGGLERYVVKPTISGGAAETWVTGAPQQPGEQERLERVLERSGAMLQAYLPEVAAEGEWSMMFFGGLYSHSVMKLPATGDFRVQTEHGGSVVAGTPPAELIEEAEDILRGLRQKLLYARVDGLVIDGEFTLLELELIEPELFFRCDPGAPERFVEALLDMAGEGSQVPAACK